MPTDFVFRAQILRQFKQLLPYTVNKIMRKCVVRTGYFTHLFCAALNPLAKEKETNESRGKGKENGGRWSTAVVQCPGVWGRKTMSLRSAWTIYKINKRNNSQSPCESVRTGPPRKIVKAHTQLFWWAKLSSHAAILNNFLKKILSGIQNILTSKTEVALSVLISSIHHHCFIIKIEVNENINQNSCWNCYPQW